MQSALHGNISCAMCRTLLVEDEEAVARARNHAQMRAIMVRRQSAFRRAIRMSERKRTDELQKTIHSYKRAKVALKKAKEAKAAVVERIRHHRTNFGEKGVKVSVDHRVARRVQDATRQVYRAKRRIEDEMMANQL